MKRTTGSKAARENQGGHPPRKRRLKTLEDLRRYLADTIQRLEDGSLDDSAAKTRAYLVNILSGIIKDSDIEARLAALESAIEVDQHGDARLRWQPLSRQYRN